MSSNWKQILAFLLTVLATNLGTNGFQFSRWTTEASTAQSVREAHLQVIMALADKLEECRADD